MLTKSSVSTETMVLKNKMTVLLPSKKLLKPPITPSRLKRRNAPSRSNAKQNKKSSAYKRRKRTPEPNKRPTRKNKIRPRPSNSKLSIERRRSNACS